MTVDAEHHPVYRTGFAFLVLACAAASYFSRDQPADTNAAEDKASFKSSKDDLDSGLEAGEGELPSPSSLKEGSAFKLFQKNYLLVYGLVMTADWLQGPATYPLYQSYGYELDQIAVLFVVGFLSSAIFGTILGSLADKAGRKRACLLFCAVYAASCITKLSSNYAVLLFGRLLGGISTSLLFSVFEAWMVSEHHSRGFRESLLSDTFAWAIFLNGLVAILSGLLAHALTSMWGEVSPFMGSMAFLVAAAFVIQPTWRENYGSNDKNEGTSTSILDVMKLILKDQDILAVGIMQCLFESAMYTFVFLWSPVLKDAALRTLPAGQEFKGPPVPYGLIFAAFMVSIMLGSVAFKVLLRRGMKHEDIARITFGLAAFALVVPVFVSDEPTVFVTFNLFEFSCGLYFPTLGTLRSKLVPEETRSTVMNVFRIPLNLIVVVALLKVHEMNSSTLFAICGMLVAVSFVFSIRLRARLLGKGSRSTVVWTRVDGDAGATH
ncbi:uncharacterized protein EV422DRAFT_19599 [Fimicolochytrium jonesii]|uniref:uncharacterized protein n=1 Tax=Fimicolochytrium jonesii TaxID=1396493 RepID=UPI0022FDB0C1|nr:uncharacterized protein EV422DRAFT_19599 [Fimicolochytrium jonesii]KAI8826967.1 hypothetical protein EV422DRAFT_19599 [Fimicolochytrium jonesii]